MLIFEGKEISTDSEGYLKDTTLWSEPLAEKIAENEGITLSAEHWKWCVLSAIFIWNLTPPRYPHAG
jgi:TusE/DsrC/DsvC family sulfur relay protein